MTRTYREAWFPKSRNDPTGSYYFHHRMRQIGGPPVQVVVRKDKLLLRDGMFQTASLKLAKRQTIRELRHRARVEVVRFGEEAVPETRRSPVW